MSPIDERYHRAADEYGPALQRLARAYEAEPDKRRDLLQEIHVQLWRSFQSFDGRCSERTWVYRVAHHVGASHVIRERRAFSRLVSLEELDQLPDKDRSAGGLDERRDLERLAAFIRQLKPLDRQVIVCYLEEMDAATIGDITGLSAAGVAMRIHRIKKLLARRFEQGVTHAEQPVRSAPSVAESAADAGRDTLQREGTARED